MTRPNIVWTRIDERLLHGQIRITWGKHTEANLILVANDDAADGPNSAFMQAGMKASAGGEYAVRFFSIQKQLMSSIKPLLSRRFSFCVTPRRMLRVWSKAVCQLLSATWAICTTTTVNVRLPKQSLWMKKIWMLPTYGRAWRGLYGAEHTRPNANQCD